MRKKKRFFGFGWGRLETYQVEADHLPGNLCCDPLGLGGCSICAYGVNLSNESEHRIGGPAVLMPGGNVGVVHA